MKTNTLFIAVNIEKTMFVSTNEEVLRRFLEQAISAKDLDYFALISYSFGGCGRQQTILNHKTTKIDPRNCGAMKLIEKTFMSVIQGIESLPTGTTSVQMGKEKRPHSPEGQFKFVRKVNGEKIKASRISATDLVQEILAAAA